MRKNTHGKLSVKSVLKLSRCFACDPSLKKKRRSELGLTREDWKALKRRGRKEKDAACRTRYLIVICWGEGWAARLIAQILLCAASTVYRVIARFKELGEPGLIDGREDNGNLKVTEKYLYELTEVLKGSPQDYGYKRPTWTRELLVEVMAEKTDVRIHPSTMSRVLRRIRARRGRPKPSVRCPLSERARKRRLKKIRDLIDSLPPGEAALYSDEVEIHLNPNIGYDWMLPGARKEVITPGVNEKRHIAGAMQGWCQKLFWVVGKRKDSELFVRLLYLIAKEMKFCKKIHLIVDNYKIHRSRRTKTALQSLGGKIELHFLPPYSPEDNRIEKLWLDLHNNVTRNHKCETIHELMENVQNFLEQKAKNYAYEKLEYRAA